MKNDKALLTRIRILSGVILLVAAVLLARLYFVQIVYGDEFAERANHQYVSPTQYLYDRGSVFFTNREGNLVSGATLKSGFVVAINPSRIDDPEALFHTLDGYLDLDREAFLAQARKADDPYEEVADRVDEQTAQRIAELNRKGVDVFKQRWRFYPGGSLAAHTLGFVAFEGDDLKGVYGLERYYDDILTRDEGGVYVNFFAEIFSNLNKTIFKRPAYRAGDVITSLEPSVQLFLENRVREVAEEWGSVQAGGVIIDPHDGSVYALSVHPAFDLNRFKEVDNASLFSNPLVEGVYELGSIFKPLTMAIGLDTDSVSAQTTYYDNGFIELNGSTISNYDGESRGRVDMQEVLNQSLNTGAAFVVGETGNEVFARYMRAFGVGEETGIDLPSESRGIVDNLKSPRDLEYATAAFGQGIAVTPIAMVRALSVLANGGVLITPHVAQKVRGESGITRTVAFSDGTRVIQEETSDEITRMLVNVVDETTLGDKIGLPRYSIAAKTGTAQIAKEGERGYYDNQHLHSFFGYFPAYEPRFLVFLFTIKPQGVRFASQTLTRPFTDITEFLINYYDIPPDR